MSPASPARWAPPHAAETHPVPRDGRRNCGVVEQVLRRQWDPDRGLPPASLIHAIDRIAGLPVHLASRMATWLDGLWLGDGAVPDLDDLWFLRGQLVRDDSKILWDHEPAAVIGRTMVLGTGDHLSVSLVDHELGHVLDMMDGMSDRPDWQTIMWRCRPLVLHPRYQDPAELWAEGYAHVATGELRRLTRLLGGNSEIMEMMWAYYRHQLGLEVSPK